MTAIQALTGKPSSNFSDNIAVRAQYEFEKEFGPHRDSKLFQPFLAGAQFGLRLSRDGASEYLGLVARSIETGWKGVIVEVYKDDDGQEMFIMYKDTDDRQHFAQADVIVYPSKS